MTPHTHTHITEMWPSNVEAYHMRESIIKDETNARKKKKRKQTKETNKNSNDFPVARQNDIVTFQIPSMIQDDNKDAGKDAEIDRMP